MSKVMIKPANKETGSKIGAYNVTEGKEAWGFMVLRSESNVFKNGIFNKESRNCLVRGPIEGLKEVVGQNPTGVMPGRIRVVEYTENNIPADVLATQLNTKLIDEGKFEEAIAPYVKRAGKNGPVLLKDSEKVLRFQVYDPTLELKDVFVQHDPATEENTAEVTAEVSEEIETVIPGTETK